MHSIQFQHVRELRLGKKSQKFYYDKNFVRGEKVLYLKKNWSCGAKLTEFSFIFLPTHLSNRNSFSCDLNEQFLHLFSIGRDWKLIIFLCDFNHKAPQWN